MSDQPHISEQIAERLTAMGFNRTSARNDALFTKHVKTGGAFGKSLVIIRIDQTGRWLDRIDGWGTVEQTCDTRDYPDDPKGAIDAVLTNGVK